MVVSARKNLLGLMLGVTVLFVCALLLSFGFSHFLARQASHERQAKMIYQVITMVKQHQAVSSQQLIALNRPWLPIHLAKHQPLQSVELTPALTQADILSILAGGRNVKQFSLQLTDKSWLIIDVPVGPSQAVVITVYSVAALLLLALLLFLCYWIVYRLARPLKALEKLSASIEQEKGMTSTEPELQSIIAVINQLQLRIRVLSKAKTEMLAAISHDLRTPITRLKLRSEAFKNTEQYPKIQSDLDEMEQMIDSILSFVQDETEESPVKFDLHALLETVVNDQHDAGYEVSFVASEQAVPFTGRMLALKRVFTNLVDNAIKYGEQAVLTLKVTRQEIVITIDDQGPGLDENELKKVFQPFYRAANTNHVVGSGLGLVFVQNTIVQHQGQVDLSNLPAGGLRATVRFNF